MTRKTPATPAAKKRRSAKASESKSASRSAKSRDDRAIEPLYSVWTFPVPFPEGEPKPVCEFTVHPDVVRHILALRLEKLHAGPKASKDDPLSVLHAELAAKKDRGAAYTAASLDAAMDWPLRLYIGLVLEVFDLFLTLAALEGSHVAMFGATSGRGRKVSRGLKSAAHALIDDFAKNQKDAFLFRTKAGQPGTTDDDIQLFRIFEREKNSQQDAGQKARQATKKAKIEAARQAERQGRNLSDAGLVEAIGRGRAAAEKIRA